MSNKEIYKALCEQADLPLFMQYWWLEAVSAGKDWDVLLITENNASAIDAEAASEEGAEAQQEAMPHVVAAMPYETEKHLWMRRINQPVLTPYAGIWVAPEKAGDPDCVADLYRRLEEQLKNAKPVSFNQLFRPDSPAVHRLTDLGFKFVTRRTYILSDLSDLQKVIDGFSRNKRKKLEKNTLTYSVADIEPEEFFYFHQQTSAQKKDKLQYSRETLLVVAEKALQRNQMRVFGVKNADGELMAAAVLVWDKRYAYLLLNTFDHDIPDSGARELLTLEAIKQTRTLGLKLDFVYHRDYLKHYGARKTTFYSVHKGRAPYVLMQRFIDWCKH